VFPSNYTYRSGPPAPHDVRDFPIRERLFCSAAGAGSGTEHYRGLPRGIGPDRTEIRNKVPSGAKTFFVV